VNQLAAKEQPSVAPRIIPHERFNFDVPRWEIKIMA